MSTKKAYEQKQQAQLNEWAAQIKKLKAKADVAQADAQLEYYRQINELRSMQDVATNKLNEIEDASDGAWEDLKAGMDSARNSFGNALKTAASRFN
ncbi:hypothetical protein [Brumicola pallidula]|jgi:hypothetical protein|uniref:Coiled coil domain-containing protein n=1 Tax=Brumicola pallidula DSM 14239 = ACAM 615 TaxID=1121922 RepID=K6Z2X1_9ALTE|nr:hypothetical protein [Glaciecola pallidula]GAC30586.1 hypothetical protein GPAL_3746 [Glaciecola pallidula DSM 14239 = ACAM 615]